MKKTVRFILPNPPSLKEMEKDFAKIYQNRIFTNMGPFERKFEAECAKFLKTPKVRAPHVVLVSNATIALTLALKALEPKRPLVLLPSFTFAATLEAILWCGLRPVFVDIDTDSWSMAPTEWASILIKSRKVGAVMLGNPHGIPADIEAWTEICKRYDVPILIDSAAGMGSVYSDGIPVGLKGSAEVLSLHITKTFGIGEGGLIVTKDQSLAEKLQKMKNFGFDENHVVQTLGTNAKVPEFASVIGLHVLKNYQKTLVAKKALIRLYLKHLSPAVKTHKNILLAAGQYFPVLFPDKKTRAQKQAALTRAGVDTRQYYYPPLHQHPAFESVEVLGSLKNTESVAERILALPLHLGLTQSDIKMIAEIINK